MNKPILHQSQPALVRAREMDKDSQPTPRNLQQIRSHLGASSWLSVCSVCSCTVAAFFANLPDTKKERGRLVVRFLERNCVDGCFLPGVGLGGKMMAYLPEKPHHERD